LVLTAFLLFFPQFVSPYAVVLLTEVFIYAIFATSLNLLVGYLGLPSLGHGAFFGVGGYGVAILVARGGISSFWLCLGAALLGAATLSIAFGFLTIRTSGIFFLMLTFALAQLVWGVVWSWRPLTGGDDGLPGIVRPDLGLPLYMRSEINFYYLILIFFAIAMFLLYRICRSPFGHVLQGIRESETRMQVLGYNTWKYKYACFVLAGTFGGLAGALKAYQDGFVSPLYASILTSGMAMLMCLVGGTGVFIGPAIGATVVWIIRSIVSSYTGYWSLVLGIILIIVVMFARQGIFGYLAEFRGVRRRVRAKS
jgi:branched-chain amino acid transport system permease protein